MIMLVIGLIVGMIIGIIIMACFSAGAYAEGFEDGKRYIIEREHIWEDSANV